MNSVLSAQVRLCKSLTDLGAEKSWRACPERRVIKRNVTCTAGEWEEAKSKERSVAGGQSDTLTVRKLETVSVSAEGCQTRIGFRRSCCAVMSWSWGKMRENCKVTLTKSELMFVFEGHVEGKGRKQNYLGSVMCYECC